MKVGGAGWCQTVQRNRSSSKRMIKTFNSIPHKIHGAAIFTCISFQNQPNAGKYTTHGMDPIWVWIESFGIIHGSVWFRLDISPPKALAEELLTDGPLYVSLLLYEERKTCMIRWFSKSRWRWGVVAVKALGRGGGSLNCCMVDPWFLMFEMSIKCFF